jgi:hypothetical protein
MKNKPDPALLGGSYIFKEIKKRTPKSRETIPLKEHSHEKVCEIIHLNNRFSPN